MSTIDALAERLGSYLPQEQIQQVCRAYFYAEQAHDGQYRKSGEPYIIHPLAVADILASMQLDYQTLMAAMLHDVIEDTGIPKKALHAQFGEIVADLVDGVSKLNKMEFATKAEAQAENFQKMVLAMASDIRVIVVKLADRLHNMRTLGAMQPASQRRIARETLDIYAPIAGRLGMHLMRTELEDLAFAAHFPMRSKHLLAAVNKTRESRKEQIEQVQQSIHQRLQEQKLSARVVWRQRHLNSIYNKMYHERKRLVSIMATQVVAIVTDKVDTCYRILGALHSLYKPVPGTFSDYIAIPKANAYQALHTTLFTGKGFQLEVLIRTEEMEMVANLGIATQWSSKSHQQLSSDRLQGSHSRAQRWVANLLEMRERAASSLEFIEHVKEDLFPDEIYVFTPKGKIMELPRGATPVDFAYGVHTQVGNTCVGCYLDGHLAALSSPLQSGQTVEIITKENSHPNMAWLNFVVTGKARSSIRHYLKNLERSESIELGRRLLTQAANQFGYSLDSRSEVAEAEILLEFNYPNWDTLLENVGLGQHTAHILAHRLRPRDNKEQSPSTAVSKTTNSQQALTISGSESMLVKFARCCFPIPGDPILGHFSSGHLMVHHAHCRNTQEWMNKADKCLNLTWDSHRHREFPTRLKAQVQSQRGIISSLVLSISQAEANLLRIDTHEQAGNLLEVEMDLQVRDRVHLARVLRRLRHLKTVIKIQRIHNCQ